MTTHTEAESEPGVTSTLAQPSFAGGHCLLSAELGTVWMGHYTCLAHYGFHR